LTAGWQPDHNINQQLGFGSFEHKKSSSCFKAREEKNVFSLSLIHLNLMIWNFLGYGDQKCCLEPE